jgi:nucleoside-diphosphate-sugar epimerase
VALPLWKDRQVLVTGATGFIGSHLAERLLDEGAQVRVFVRDPARLIAPLRDRVEVVRGDLNQPDSFAAAVAGREIVFHIATWDGSPNSRQAAYTLNVTASRQLAEAARSAGARRFIHTSSMAVYGPLQTGLVDETQPHWPIYLYAETKSLGEQAVRETPTNRFGVTIIRPTEVFGPRSPSWTLLPVKLARRGWPVLIGGGQGLCHPVYIDNLIDAYLYAATRPEAIGEAFTICDADLPWRDFFGRYAAMAGQPARSIPIGVTKAAAALAEVWIKIARRPMTINRAMIGYVIGHCRFSTEKAKRLLGWSPRVPFDEAMRRTEAWLHEAGYL